MSAPTERTSLAGFDWPGLDRPPTNRSTVVDQALHQYREDILAETREIQRLLDLLAAASQTRR